MSPFSVLVVDDEPENFSVIEALLKIDNIPIQGNQSLQLHHAIDGETAMSCLDLYNPDLILLDIMMPGIDGIEVCRKIKAMPRWDAVPIIIVTAITTRSDLARCLSAGANDFINKPINAVELKARVHSMLLFKHKYDRVHTLCNTQRQTIDELQNQINELINNFETLG